MTPELPSTDFSSVNPTAVLKVSRLILRSFPHFPSKLSAKPIAEEFSETISEKQIDELKDFWRFLIYYQPKEVDFRQYLTQISIPEDIHSKMVEIWLEDGSKAVERAMKCTSTGIPRVQDVRCTTQLSIANNASNQCRDPDIILHLDTDAGPRKLILSRSKAETLFNELNILQKSLDDLVE